MKKAIFFVLFFAMFLPIITFGALQATSKIISNKDGQTVFSTTISGLTAGQKAEYQIGVRVKGADSDPISGVIKQTVSTNGTFQVTVNKNLPATNFNVYAKAGAPSATEQTNGLPVSTIRIIEPASETAHIIPVGADFTNLKDYTVWKVGVQCEQEKVNYDPTNSPLDKGREFYFQSDDGKSLYLYEKKADKTIEKIREAGSKERDEFFNKRILYFDFMGAKPSSQYRCLVYAVKGGTIGSTVSYSNWSKFNTANLEAYIEEYCVVNENTIDVLMSYYGYNVAKEHPVVYLRYQKQGKDPLVVSDNWVKTSEQNLPSDPNGEEEQNKKNRGERCIIKKNNQIRIRLTGLNPQGIYFVAPGAYIPNISYSIIEWETMKAGTNYDPNKKVLLNGKKDSSGIISLPRTVTPQAIQVKTMIPVLVNQGKSVFGKCAEYVTLKASIIDKRLDGTNYDYWFQIVDGENVYCTYKKSAKAGTNDLFLDVSSCNPDYTVFNCAKDGSPLTDSANRKTFRLFPNKQYTIIALAKGVNDKSTSVGDPKEWSWTQKQLNQTPTVKISNSADQSAVRVVGTYTLGQNVYAGAFRIVEVNSQNKEVGKAFITLPTASKVYSSNSFYYDISSGQISALDETGEHSITATIKPNTKYKVDAIVYNLATRTGKKSTIPQYILTKNNIYGTNIKSKIEYLTQINSVDAEYSKLGCWDTSVVMDLKYWVEQSDTSASTDWYNVHSNPPTLAYCYFDSLADAKRANFKIIKIKTNDPTYIKNNFLNRGIPLVFYCIPSHNSGVSTNHYSLISNYNSGTQYYIASDGKKYLNDVHIFDPGWRGVDDLNIQARRNEWAKQGIYTDLKCGYQYGVDKVNLVAECGGLCAIVPQDVAKTIKQDSFIEIYPK